MKITLSLKIRAKIVKIDKKQNPLKYIAENGSSLLQCIWIVCTTPELVCGGGEQGIETPCILAYLSLLKSEEEMCLVFSTIG